MPDYSTSEASSTGPDICRCPVCSSALPDDLAQPHPCFGRPILNAAGIIDLAREDHYWNQIPRETMAELCTKAASDGCRAALETFLKPVAGEPTFQYAWDERRADWFPVCGLPDEPVIVDIGAGWGAVTTGLARLGGRVFALDSNIETLKFQTIRAKENALTNITCVHVDPLELAPLPFEDGVADLVVMNGLLEWVGAAVEEGDPGELQLAAVREAWRVLKPGGTLYVGIESRFGFSFWRGAEDHRGTRFTSLLPRRLASWVTRRRGLGDYRTYTHSYHGLRQMLRAAGFQDARFYEPYPTYRMAGRMVPIDDARVLRRSVAAAGISRKHAWALIAASWLGIHRDFVDTYGVVAHK